MNEVFENSISFDAALPFTIAGFLGYYFQWLNTKDHKKTTRIIVSILSAINAVVLIFFVSVYAWSTVILFWGHLDGTLSRIKPAQESLVYTAISLSIFLVIRKVIIWLKKC